MDATSVSTTYKTSERKREAFKRWYQRMSQDPEWLQKERERQRVWRENNQERYRESMRAANKRYYLKKKKASSTQSSGAPAS
jgi:hypothetical protein